MKRFSTQIIKEDALYEQGKLERILPLMMVNGAAHIYEGALSAFRLKRVRVIGQNDECGLNAAARWERQLSAAGADVDVWVAPKFSLGDGLYTKDIDEIYGKLGEDGRKHVEVLGDIFDLDRKFSSVPTKVK